MDELHWMIKNNLIYNATINQKVDGFHVFTFP